jgi:hypothetical protein
MIAGQDRKTSLLEEQKHIALDYNFFKLISRFPSRPPLMSIKPLHQVRLPHTGPSRTGNGNRRRRHAPNDG